MRDPTTRVPRDVIARETRRIMGAPHLGARFWRALGAAWRCARVASRHLARERARDRAR
jgi:hypothetical protein